jgi:hypothetical protein
MVFHLGRHSSRDCPPRWSSQAIRIWVHGSFIYRLRLGGRPWQLVEPSSSAKGDLQGFRLGSRGKRKCRSRRAFDKPSRSRGVRRRSVIASFTEEHSPGITGIRQSYSYTKETGFTPQSFSPLANSFWNGGRRITSQFLAIGCYRVSRRCQFAEEGIRVTTRNAHGRYPH